MLILSLILISKPGSMQK